MMPYNSGTSTTYTAYRSCSDCIRCAYFSGMEFACLIYDVLLKANPTKWKLLPVTASLFVLVGATVTVQAQESHFTSSEFSRPVQEMSIDELARRYGIIEAIEFSLRLQQQEDDRREMERIKEAQRRDRELREKVKELAQTSLELYQRFNNPSEIHADTPQLAKKCEELSKAVRRLLR